MNDTRPESNPVPAPPAGASPWATSLGRLLRQPRFLVAAAFLAVSAAGLSAATQFMQLHFRKKPVPLPVRSLNDEAQGIPAKLGAWVQVSRDQPLEPEVEEALGTRQYVVRQYVDTRLRPRAAEEFKDLSYVERQRKLAELQSEYARDPGAPPRVLVLTMQMNYYTGLVDTVAHIPDRCYVADGYEPVSKETRVAPGAGFADGQRGARRDVPFRFIDFEDQTGRGRVRRYVGYFFQVDGDYTDDPIQVRKKLQQLIEPYGYYAKIELMAELAVPAGASEELKQKQDEAWRGVAEAAIRDFITGGLPEIEKRLPDWPALKRAKP